MECKANALDYTKRYQVQVGSKKRNVQVHWKAIDALYTYNGKLGVTYTPEVTEFKLWAPLASTVSVLIFEDGLNDDISYQKVLKRGDKGVWSTQIEGDYFGKFHQFAVTNYGETNNILAPYAFSKAVDNSDGVIVGKAAILDPSKIGPKLEYAKIEGFEKREDAIIYEIHVRDFTSDPDLTTKAPFETYGAFTERIDYIKILG